MPRIYSSMLLSSMLFLGLVTNSSEIKDFSSRISDSHASEQPLASGIENKETAPHRGSGR